MMWALGGLIAAAGLASLIFWYHYWRRLTEPEYRLPDFEARFRGHVGSLRAVLRP